MTDLSAFAELVPLDHGLCVFTTLRAGGGVQATVTFAGMLAGTIGLYQLNVTVPNVAAGDQAIEFIVDGVSNSQNLFIAIGQ